MNSNISLIGYRGVGKSTLGKLLAEELNMKFIDIDNLIESKIGMSIKAYFEKYGEKEFRKIEQIKVQETLTKNKRSIIAHGGGVVLNNKNRYLLKAFSKVIFLNLDKETIFTRINNETRPSLTEFSFSSITSGILPDTGCVTVLLVMAYSSPRVKGSNSSIMP